MASLRSADTGWMGVTQMAEQNLNDPRQRLPSSMEVALRPGRLDNIVKDIAKGIQKNRGDKISTNGFSASARFNHQMSVLIRNQIKCCQKEKYRSLVNYIIRVVFSDIGANEDGVDAIITLCLDAYIESFRERVRGADSHEDLVSVFDDLEGTESATSKVVYTWLATSHTNDEMVSVQEEDQYQDETEGTNGGSGSVDANEDDDEEVCLLLEQDQLDMASCLTQFFETDIETLSGLDQYAEILDPSDPEMPLRPFDDDEAPLDRPFVSSAPSDTRPAIYSGFSYTSGERRLREETQQLSGSQRPSQYFTREGGQYSKRQAIIAARVNYPEIFLLEIVVLKLIEQANLLRFWSLKTSGTYKYTVLAKAFIEECRQGAGIPEIPLRGLNVSLLLSEPLNIFLWSHKEQRIVQEEVQKLQERRILPSDLPKAIQQRIVVECHKSRTINAIRAFQYLKLGVRARPTKVDKLTRSPAALLEKLTEVAQENPTMLDLQLGVLLSAKAKDEGHTMSFATAARVATRIRITLGHQTRSTEKAMQTLPIDDRLPRLQHLIPISTFISKVNVDNFISADDCFRKLQEFLTNENCLKAIKFIRRVCGNFSTGPSSVLSPIHDWIAKEYEEKGKEASQKQRQHDVTATLEGRRLIVKLLKESVTRALMYATSNPEGYFLYFADLNAARVVSPAETRHMYVSCLTGFVEQIRDSEQADCWKSISRATNARIYQHYRNSLDRDYPKVMTNRFGNQLLMNADFDTLSKRLSKEPPSKSSTLPPTS